MDNARRVDARRLIVFLELVACILAAWTERANTHQTSPKLSKTAREQTADSNSIATDAREDSSGSSPEFVLKPWRALRSHLHNKIIHVPIGFALSAFLLSLLAIRRPEVYSAIRWLVLVAAVGSIAAFLTGSNQAPAYDGSSKEWVVDLHRDLGLATGAAVSIWCVTLWVRSRTKWAFFAGVLAIALLVLAGFFGGIIAHG
jgi:uncharacterized membrane protein